MDMQLAEWSDKLEFGLPRIDSQHKQHFDLAATFAGNGDQIRVMKSLVMLSNYAKVHLRDEEEMLASLKYPERRHRQGSAIPDLRMVLQPHHASGCRVRPLGPHAFTEGARLNDACRAFSGFRGKGIAHSS